MPQENDNKDGLNNFFGNDFDYNIIYKSGIFPPSHNLHKERNNSIPFNFKEDIERTKSDSIKDMPELKISQNERSRPEYKKSVSASLEENVSVYDEGKHKRLPKSQLSEKVIGYSKPSHLALNVNDANQHQNKTLNDPQSNNFPYPSLFQPVRMEKGRRRNSVLMMSRQNTNSQLDDSKLFQKQPNIKLHEISSRVVENPVFDSEAATNENLDQMPNLTNLPLKKEFIKKDEIIDILKQTQQEKKLQKNESLDAEIERKLRKLIDEWYNFCEQTSILHSMCQSHYNKIGNAISLSAISLSTLGGTSSLASSGEGQESHRIFAIILGIVSLVSGTLMTIHRYFNFNQLEKDHSFYSSEYAKLKNEMHMQMYIHQCSSKTYVNLVEFCKAIKGTLDSLIDRAPNIPSIIANNRKYIRSSIDQRIQRPFDR